MPTNDQIVIRVLQEDIANGKPGCGDLCPIAIAGQRETNGGHCSLHDDVGQWVFELHGRSIVAPREMVQFALAFDGDRRVKPTMFVLPPLIAPEWKDKCYDCEGLFDSNDLDDEGHCSDCAKEPAHAD